MKKIIYSILMLIMLVCPFLLVNAESDKFYTITCNPGEESSEEVRINWHTNTDLTNSYVLYTKKTDTNWENAIKVAGECFENTAFTGLNAIGNVINQNGAVLSNLEADTEYMYKISDGSDESDVRYFKTSGDSVFSFIWTSDFHAYYDDARRLNNATANIQEAIKMNNGVDFILSTGDTVAHGGTYKWWKQVADINWMKNYMYVDTLGNHDWMTATGTYVADGATNKFFSATHNNPKNGYSGQENVCYYFYYSDVLFIVLNTEEYSQAQYDWAESVLKSANAQYIVMVQHYEAFTPTGGKKSSGYNRWHNLCDEYGVDLFLSGNSHSYIRSNPIYKDKLGEDGKNGTVYMVAPSSDGDRGVSFNGITSNTDLIAKGWAGGTTQVACSIVSFSPSGIVTKLVNKGGEVLDVGVISAKRAPTSRTTKDLSGINKEDIEKSIEISYNSKDISAPRVKYHEDTAFAVRKMKITNTKTKEVIYDGVLKDNSKYFNLSNIKKGLYNFDIELEYYDNTTGLVNIDLANTPKWGSLSNIKETINGSSITITWKESIVSTVVKHFDLYLNDEFKCKVNVGEKSVTIDDLIIGNNKVELKVIDNDDDVVGTLILSEPEIKIAEYNVIFKDKDGNVIEEVKVKEGEAANAPAAPVVTGFEFTGWDKDFNNVTSDLEVTAQYVKIFTVIFKDKD